VSLKTGEVRVLHRGGYYGRYLPGGWLVYISQGTLFGVKFDADRLLTLGAPVPVVEDVAANPVTGGGQFDCSATGTFVYSEGKSAAQRWQISWLDATGAMKPLIRSPGAYAVPRISRDGKKLAFMENADVYVYDLDRDTTGRLSFTGANSRLPVWAPDSKHLVVQSSKADLLWIRSDGAEAPQKLLGHPNNVVTAWSMSQDGKWLAYFEKDPDTGFDIWTLPLDLHDPDHP
jgi:serine/threonine-protein kinase